MTLKFKALSVQHLDDALAPFREASRIARPSAGWAKAIREALGMTRAQLARRIHISPSTVSDLERNEARGTITLESLERLARGMGCGVVYAIVPLGGKSLQDVVQEQAQAVAREQLGRVSHTMRLEEQGLNATQERRQFDRFVESLLSGSRRNLWR